MIRRHRTALFVLALALLAPATQAQNIWKWRDTNGTLQISDHPPPTSVAEKDILARPGAQRGSIMVSAEAVPEAGASGPARTDPELEARKKKLQSDKAAADAERKAADKARVDSLKADNCRRAKAQLAMLESGVRVARPNAKGEREFLDDRGRAEEVARSRAAVNDNCQ